MITTFIIVGFYTENYKDSATNFASSCIKHGVPFYLENIDDKGGWNKNTSYKPKFLSDCMSRFCCNIIYCDVDAEFLKFPTLFNEIKSDIAFYKGSVWNDSRVEVLSGTIFLKHSELVLKFLERWAGMCNHSNEWDQVLIEPSIIPAMKVEHLPIEYCAIFDSPRVQGKDIVIKHLQHSRAKKR